MNYNRVPYEVISGKNLKLFLGVLTYESEE